MIFDEQIAFKTANYLLQINAIKLNPENPFLWASGWRSPIYCDNRVTLSYPEIRNYLCEKLANQIISIYGNDHTIVGVATGAIGIGMLVANKLDLPFVYVRPESKTHGRKNKIEGYLSAKSKVVVIEDLISTGKSSLLAVEALKKECANVLGMLALFTYGFNDAELNFKNARIKLNTLTNYEYLIKEAIASGKLDSSMLSKLNKWREYPNKWKP